MVWIPGWMQAGGLALCDLCRTYLGEDLVDRARRGDADATAQVCEVLLGEAICEVLLSHLAEARSTRVRGSQCIPESAIARAAVELLKWRGTHNLPPERALIDLIAKLMHVDGSDASAPKNRNARYDAAHLFSENPTISISRVAKLTGMDKSSVSKMIKSDGFKKEVEELKGLGPAKVAAHLNTLFDVERKARKKI